MTRTIQLAGWLAAVNAVVITASLGLGITGESLVASTRTFAAWCGIA